MGSSLTRFSIVRALVLGSAIAVASGTLGPPGEALAGEPTAQDRETAIALMTEGDKAFDAKEWAKALEKYKAAHVLVNLPSTGIWVAKTLEKLGRLIEARQTALDATRLPKKPGERDAVGKARTEAEQLASTLATRIPSLEIVVSGPPEGTSYELEVDGEAVRPELLKIARKVDPGIHKAKASATGYKPATGELDVKEGTGVAKLVLTLYEDAGAPIGPGAKVDPVKQPDAVAPEGEGEGGGIHPLTWVGVATAGAGVLVGSITGGISLGAASKAKDNCDNPEDTTRCSDNAADAIDKSKATAWASNISFGVAGVGAVLFIVGIALPTGPPEKTAAVSLCGGPGGTLGPCFRF